MLRFVSNVPRQLVIGVIFAILSQWLIVTLCYVGIIHDPYHPVGTFLFHQGGDQDSYFALAQSIVNGTLVTSKYTLGYPLLLVPWIALTHPATAGALTPWMSFLHSVILFPIAQLIFAAIVYRFTHRIALTLICVFAWTWLPVAYYLAVSVHDQSLAGVWAVHLVWLQMLSDPPTAFLTLLSIWLMLNIFDVTNEKTSIVWAILLGAVCGLLLLIRINSVFSVVGVLVALGMKRRWRTCLWVVGIAALCFLPQLVYNAVVFGNPFTLGYQVVDSVPTQGFYGMFSPHYLIAFFAGRYRLLAWSGLIGIGAIFILGLVATWHIDKAFALAIGVWCAGYACFFGLYYYSWTGSLTRFLIPVYPAAILLAVNGLDWLSQRIRRRRVLIPE